MYQAKERKGLVSAARLAADRARDRAAEAPTAHSFLTPSWGSFLPASPRAFSSPFVTGTNQYALRMKRKTVTAGYKYTRYTLIGPKLSPETDSISVPEAEPEREEEDAEHEEAQPEEEAVGRVDPGGQDLPQLPAAQLDLLEEVHVVQKDGGHLAAAIEAAPEVHALQQHAAAVAEHAEDVVQRHQHEV
eukprot:CAMPEP_0113818860 /NCGR_PEP_ID=MMETSP0328-20130328/451_1 /TAXON_ID=39455 /ORGANISM="Alexandrium minutum" /LENGTH=188 /DNA_ID=CAMNT_0000786795 /DNA_START=90 /DNA_END=658 /DNA_ORIENTATION=- /assembly_acc=CAM_ASM_000350